jgi:ribose transport system substrate-binding protein
MTCRTLAVLLMLALAAAGLPACTSKPKGPRQTIGVSLLTMTNPFFAEMAETMKEEGTRKGLEVIITDGDKSASKQNDQVKDFLARKVSAIVLSPCDSRSVGTAIAEANRAGVPVFTADIACLAQGVQVVTHVATDNLEGGRLAGREMVKLLGGKGKVAILDFPVVESVLLRSKGFREEVAKAPGISIVAVAEGGGDKAMSRAAAQDIIQTHQDLDAFFSINDPSALGAIAAIEEARRTDRVKVIGFDGQPEARQAVKDGKLHATIMQYPRNIGARSIDAVARYMEGEKLPAETLIPATVYRREDALKDPDLK